MKHFSRWGHGMSVTSSTKGSRTWGTWGPGMSVTLVKMRSRYDWGPGNYIPFILLGNLCSELCGFFQTISIKIIHVSMYYLWRFFIHKLIRIPNFWSMRTRMREDADKDGPSGLTSRMNKIL